MVVFHKDISERDHVHAREASDPGLKEYMDYQRQLFPYTIIRAGLDLAYKELDDILNFIDNDYQPPPDSERKDYPSDANAWYRSRFPWTGSFLEMEDMHDLLVILIKAMDSFRTQEIPNTYHWVVLYDCTNNIIEIYNEFLRNEPGKAHDIQLSQGKKVDFDDFVNNYWEHLDFMLLSKPDYPHDALLGRNRPIEDAFKQKMADGGDPIEILKSIALDFSIHETTVALLNRSELKPEWKTLPSQNMDADLYEHLQEEVLDRRGERQKRIDQEYEENFERRSKAIQLDG